MSTAARLPTTLAAATTLRAARTALAPAATKRPIASIPTTVLSRQLHVSPSPLRAPTPSDNPGAMPDSLSEGAVKGSTGGGQPLDSSSSHAPPKPKISNASVPGTNAQENMTEEQKKEVDEHNREFEMHHDSGNRAPDDKVNKKFWSTERGSE